jgi:hypothetical protein
MYTTASIKGFRIHFLPHKHHNSYHSLYLVLARLPLDVRFGARVSASVGLGFGLASPPPGLKRRPQCAVCGLQRSARSVDTPTANSEGKSEINVESEAIEADRGSHG